MSSIPYLAKVSITVVIMKDVVIMEASHNFPAKLQYSLDEADLQSCKYTSVSKCTQVYAHDD